MRVVPVYVSLQFEALKFSFSYQQYHCRRTSQPTIGYDVRRAAAEEHTTGNK